MYSLLRFFLFLLPPEWSHGFALGGLKVLHVLGLLALFSPRVKDDPREVFGLRFTNPVGLAAGLDKNGDCIDALGALGFGFIEVGTVTPVPQDGNPRPRLFRLRDRRALINRMGFNNKGVEHLVGRLKKRSYTGIVGVNIGKNRSTPVSGALSDYRRCLRAVYPYADYVTVNLSSPNTPGLRDLQSGNHLDGLLAGLKADQEALAERSGRHVPLLVKIAPDLSDAQISEVAGALLRHRVEGVVATNTTVDREAVAGSSRGAEEGGLSGAPLAPRSAQVIRILHEALQGRIPIVGVGGIVDGASALEKVRAGAVLVQLYTGFIYEGPKLIAAAADALREKP